MKRADLEPGTIYKCTLTLQKVLVTSKEEGVTKDKKTTTIIMAKYYNKVSGLYEITPIHDGQLIAQ